MTAAWCHESVHLDEDSLEPAEAGCSLCGSEALEPAWKLQGGPDVYLRYCTSCHAIGASRLPTDATLSRYYGGYYTSKATCSAENRVTFDHPERMARLLAAGLAGPGGQVPASLRILDLGGGDGTISCATAMQLLKMGAKAVDVTVVEISTTPDDPTDERVTVRQVTDIRQSEGRFDLVIASASLEHFTRPADVLEQLLTRVASDGLFYARTPSMVPLMRVLARMGLRMDFTYPGHLYDLGQAFWEHYFAQRTGMFRLEASRPSIVETTLDLHFGRTLAAHLLKAPWRLFGKRWGLVGGWEVMVRRARH